MRDSHSTESGEQQPWGRRGFLKLFVKLISWYLLLYVVYLLQTSLGFTVYHDMLSDDFVFHNTALLGCLETSLFGSVKTSPGVLAWFMQVV